jgi:hypothetical protein
MLIDTASPKSNELKCIGKFGFLAAIHSTR